MKYNEKDILKIYRALYDSRATDSDFTKYKDLFTIMLGEGIIENTYSGYGFTSEYKTKFFSYEDFENWIEINYIIPNKEDKKPIEKPVEIKSYNTNKRIEKLLKEFLGKDFKKVIDINPDPRNPNIFLTIVEQKSETNNGITDFRLANMQAYLVYLDVDDVREVDTGQSLVKYFSNILIDLGFSKFAVIDMDQTKNYRNWFRYKDEDWEYENVNESINFKKSFPFYHHETIFGMDDYKTHEHTFKEKYPIDKKFAIKYGYDVEKKNLYISIELIDDGELYYIETLKRDIKNLDEAKKLIIKNYEDYKSNKFSILYDEDKDEINLIINESIKFVKSAWDEIPGLYNDLQKRLGNNINKASIIKYHKLNDFFICILHYSGWITKYKLIYYIPETNNTQIKYDTNSLFDVKLQYEELLIMNNYFNNNIKESISFHKNSLNEIPELYNYLQKTNQLDYYKKFTILDFYPIKKDREYNGFVFLTCAKSSDNKNIYSVFRWYYDNEPTVIRDSVYKDDIFDFWTTINPKRESEYSKSFRKFFHEFMSDDVNEAIKFEKNTLNNIPQLYDYLKKYDMIDNWINFKVLDYIKKDSNLYYGLIYMGEKSMFKYSIIEFEPNSNKGINSLSIIKTITNKQKAYDYWTKKFPSYEYTYDFRFDQHFDDLLKPIDEEFIGHIKSFGDKYEMHKNPKSLELFPHAVRGIITNEGDLYVPKTHLIIHSEIARDLKNNKIIEYNPFIDYRHDPQKSGFLTVQREGTSNKMFIGGSTKESAILRDKKWIDNILKIASTKNPYIEFIDNKIDPKYDTIYDPEEVYENKIKNNNMKTNLIIPLQDFLNNNEKYENIFQTVNENIYDEQSLSDILKMKGELRILNIKLNDLTLKGEEGSDEYKLLLRNKYDLKNRIFNSSKNLYTKTPSFMEESGEDNNIDKNNPMIKRENQIKVGSIIEMEHKPTYEWVKQYLEENGELPPLDEFAEHISVDHIDERDDYYIPLIESGIADEEKAIDLYNKIKNGEE